MTIHAAEARSGFTNSAFWPLRILVEWRDGASKDPRHSERTAAILGISLGVSFLVCFLTGVYSHLIQHPPGWFAVTAQPAGLYRITQGMHVATGIGSVPLLLAKLWTVFPKFFRWPPFVDFGHALERLSLLPLVAGSLFQLFSGVANIDLWYVLPLNFPAGHYWMAWVVMGALVTHIGAKMATTRSALRSTTPPESELSQPDTPPHHADLANITGIVGGTGANNVSVGVGQANQTRRRFLTLVGIATGGITAVTIGETVGPLRGLVLLAPRRPDLGTQGFPVNGSAIETGVTAAVTDPNWRLRVAGNVTRALTLSIDDLRAMPHKEATLPIACVEGWSASRLWRGVSLRDLLDQAGAATGVSVTVHSSQLDGFNQSDLDAAQTTDPDTLLAMDADGEVLSLDHGYPVRLIGPNRPGVMQTKWIALVEVH